jgi:hypothetical protein
VKRLATALLALALALALPSAALAAFEPLPIPPGGRAVVAFGASGDSWVAIMDSFGAGFDFSPDNGASWREIKPEAAINDGPTVGPDGAFWFSGGTRAARQLIRATRDGTLSYVTVQVPPGTVSPPAFDSRDRMWVAVVDGLDEGTMHAIRLNADGTPAEDVQAPSFRGGLVYMRFAGDQGFLGTESEQYILEGGKLRLVAAPASQDTEFLGHMMWPVSAASGSVFTFWAMSPDGGRTFTKTARPQLGVEGRPDLLVRWPFKGQDAATIVRRCGFLFCQTGLDVPEGTSAVWATPAGLVAVSAPPAAPTGPVFRQTPVFAVHRGAVPPARATPGGLGARAGALIGAINRHRKAAGLPPLLLDPAMSRAAYNHARYLSRNPPDPKDPVITAHREVSGKPGFTGAEVTDRCKAEGGYCDVEAVVPGVAPIEGVLGSYYHRLWLLGSFAQVAGAATYRGFTVFDVDAQRSAIPARPFGYPSGRYDGPLQIGNEVPDPREVCVGSYGYKGVPVIFYPPGQEPSRPVNRRFEIREGPDVEVELVELFRGKRRVPGCGKSIAAFIAKDRLRPHTRYTAKAHWRPTPKLAPQTYIWTFTTR